uniref:Cadherin domain-containing protein n=1 Tax=Strigamia maritima TaxID=126957 RepID=T1JKF2_STRMM
MSLITAVALDCVVTLIRFRKNDENDVKKQSLNTYIYDQDLKAVHLTVLDKNDSPPVFGNSSLFYIISEDAPIGHSVVEIRAKDPDTTGSISYRLISDGNGKFRVDPANGKISVTQPLDRELQSEYELIIEANDGVQNDIRTIHIRITDVNDNAPVFEKQIYSFDVSEDSPRGAKVGQIKASDADEGGNSRVTYSVVSDWGSDILSLNPDLGVFTLTSLLDYEQVQYYMFVVQAQDSQEPTLSSTVTVYFNVLDVNDNAPLFDPMSYSKEVFENITIGTEILTVVATDQDHGDNGRIVYSLNAATKHEPFTISSDGTISTIRLLDREDKSFYNLVVIADDQTQAVDERLSSMVQVNIIVRDVNDNAPEFVTPNATAVTENAALNAVVMAVKALDKDEGRNSYIEYNLIQVGPHESKFVLGPVDGLLRVNGKLDRETCSNYSLRIVARDRGTPTLSSVTMLTVNILDENDNAPEFSPQEYSALVPENASVGASVVQVTATDRDEGQNGRLRYTIVAGDRNRNFLVAEDSGILRVAKQLDYETKNMYVLTVQAEDGGNDARHDTATVTISISDVNDSPPIFVDSPYEVSVMENVSEFPLLLATVTAKDYDAPPNNQVRYFMKDGDNNIFTINGTTGAIFVTSALDREKKSNYDVTVVAMDSGSPRLTGVGLVRIKVEDVNDSDPEFENTNYFANIIENSLPNTTVVQVLAKDIDEGLNSRIK